MREGEGATKVNGTLNMYLSNCVWSANEVLQSCLCGFGVWGGGYIFQLIFESGREIGFAIFYST